MVVDEFSFVLELVPTNGIIKPVLVSWEAEERCVEVELVVETVVSTELEELLELVADVALEVN